MTESEQKRRLFFQGVPLFQNSQQLTACLFPRSVIVDDRVGPLHFFRQRPLSANAGARFFLSEPVPLHQPAKLDVIVNIHDKYFIDPGCQSAFK